MRALALAILLASFFSLAAQAKADDTTGKPLAEDSAGTLTITLQVPRKAANIDSSLEIQVTLAYAADLTKAGGKTPSVTFRKLTLCPPPEVRAVWPGSTCGTVVLNEEIEIQAGQSQTRIVALSPSSPTLDLYQRLRYWYNFITFEPSDYSFSTQAEYNKAGSVTALSLENQFTIPLRPPLTVVVVGAVFGAALLSLFLLAMELWHYDKLTMQQGTAGAIGGRFLGVLVIGTVSASIFVALTYRLKSDTLPLSITVNDFYGGVVVGLFTFKISNWLYGQLRNPAGG